MMRRNADEEERDDDGDGDELKLLPFSLYYLLVVLESFRGS